MSRAPQPPAPGLSAGTSQMATGPAATSLVPARSSTARNTSSTATSPPLPSPAGWPGCSPAPRRFRDTGADVEASIAVVTEPGQERLGTAASARAGGLLAWLRAGAGGVMVGLSAVTSCQADVPSGAGRAHPARPRRRRGAGRARPGRRPGRPRPAGPARAARRGIPPGPGRDPRAPRAARPARGSRQRGPERTRRPRRPGAARRPARGRLRRPGGR